jgi:hypothetical protein
MPHFLKKIPLNTPPYESAPDVAISALSSQLWNGFVYPIVEEKKFLTMNRPGLYSTPFCDLGVTGKPIDGLFWWPAKSLVLATCNGKVYSINSAGTATAHTGAITQGRTKFIQAGLQGVNAVMASGGRLVSTDGTTLTTLTDTGAPTAATCVAYTDSRVIANEVGTQWFKWSDPLSVTVWNGLNLAAMEAKADVLQSVSATFDEVLLIGKYSVEHYYNDGVSPFSKYEGLTHSRGTIAPYSFIYSGNVFWWLDQERNFIKLQGNVPKVVSSPYASVIHGLSTVTDCFAMPIRTEGQNFITWNFPTDKVTLVYDVENEAWQGRWNVWDTTNALWDLWYPNAYCQCPDWGIHLAGDRRDGKIWKMSRNYMYDGDTPLRMVKRTGWRDYGIKRMKRSDRIIITIQRGTTTEVEQDPDINNEPRFTVKSRDNGEPDWQPEREGMLGFQGETESMIEFVQNGIYRTRQDEYVFSDNVPITAVDGEEEGEILSR